MSQLIPWTSNYPVPSVTFGLFDKLGYVRFIQELVTKDNESGYWIGEVEDENSPFDGLNFVVNHYDAKSLWYWD